MSAHNDPTWIRAATWVYARCLRLYPRSLHEAHGGEMLQAFRDRCREVSLGRRSAWRLFCLDLAPDLFGSAARAHADAGRLAGDSRVLPALVLLCTLAAALATQSQWSAVANDGVKAVERSVDLAREAREVRKRDHLMHGLADSMAARGDAESLAVAALVHRALFDQQTLNYAWLDGAGSRPVRYPEEGAVAARMATDVTGAGGSVASLSIATQACTVLAGCNQDFALRRLLARDPENAFNWMLEFKRAAQGGDDARMRAALAGVSRARYAQSHMATIQRVVFGQALAGDADGEMLGIVGRQFGAMRYVSIYDFRNDLRYNCSQLDIPTLYSTNWLEQHPESRGACLHLAGLLAASSDAFDSSWGWRELRLAGMAATPSRTQAMRNAVWMQRHLVNQVGYNRKPEGRGWTEWTREQWVGWNAAWAPGDGQVPATRRWLHSIGVQTEAPPDFKPFPPSG